MPDIDGTVVVHWLEKADRGMLSLLLGAAFSNADNEWLLRAVNPDDQHIEIEPADGGVTLKRHYNWFRGGTFSIENNDSFQRIHGAAAVLGNQEDVLGRIHNECLRSYGVGRPEFLAQDLRLRLGVSAMRMANAHRDETSKSDWNVILNCLESVTSENRGGVLFVLQKMLDQFEARSSRKSVYYRRCIADACRKGWNMPDEALRLTDVLDLPRVQLDGDNVSIAYLCRTRAWLFVDRAKNTFDRDARGKLKNEAQKLYQRAYGLLQNSDHTGDRDLSILKGQIDQLMS